MRLSLFVTAALVTLLSPSPTITASSWNDPTSDQYHIQTDEGAERYFRYQTHTGQYRKEKRLEDGTVVGTYGWIDSDGLLRLKDYIADNAGYRILRTKNVFVGRHRPISQAIKAAKNVPSSSGVLSNSNSYIASTPNSAYIPSNIGISHNAQTPSTTTEPPYVSSTTAPPFIITGPHSTYSTTISPLDVSSSPSSVQSTTPVYISSTLPQPSISVTSPRTVYITSKSAGVSIQSTTSLPLYSAVTKSYTSTYAPPTLYQPPSTSPPINSNFVDYYSSNPQYEHFDPKLINPYVFHNGPTYPIDHRGNPYLGYNNIVKEYDHQYDNYDGVPVTNDGFRYYIPRAYHEEQNIADKKTGSFGYIDPFGIRRVVYYSAGQDGFKHRKNNRYVGFNSPPYDERTYK